MRLFGQCLAGLAVAYGMITGQLCSGSNDQRWVYDQLNGTLSSAEAPGLCLTAVLPASPFYTLAMLPCNSVAGLQTWVFLPNNTIVLASLPAQCVNLAAYGTTPGTQIWLADCATGGCKGNCDWEAAPNGAWRNSGSQLVSAVNSLLLGAERFPPHMKRAVQCIDDGEEPPAPQTCAPGSPSAEMPFCDISLPFSTRVTDFVRRESELVLLVWKHAVL